MIKKTSELSYLILFGLTMGVYFTSNHKLTGLLGYSPVPAKKEIECIAYLFLKFSVVLFLIWLIFRKMYKLNKSQNHRSLKLIYLEELKNEGFITDEILNDAMKK